MHWSSYQMWQNFFPRTQCQGSSQSTNMSLLSWKGPIWGAWRGRSQWLGRLWKVLQTEKKVAFVDMVLNNKVGWGMVPELALHKCYRWCDIPKDVGEQQQANEPLDATLLMMLTLVPGPNVWPFCGRTWGWETASGSWWKGMLGHWDHWLRDCWDSWAIDHCPGHGYPQSHMDPVDWGASSYLIWQIN